MDTRKLMIGDKVLVKVLSQIPNTYTVHTWAAEDYLRDLLQLKPIELTPEILEKNGWKLTHDKKDYMVSNSFGVNGKNRWMNWCISEHNLDIQQQDEKLDLYNLCIQRAIIPCDYVHELQHALRLCGLDELADNFQI